MTTTRPALDRGVLDPETLSGLSWSNSKWSPLQINPMNVLEYFSDRSNPFYDRECNNEMLRMQRLNMDQLTTMVGVEYSLHSAQEPILYILCKQQRLSPTQVTPLAMYYIINGVVHQCPDLASLINSRLVTTFHHLNAGFQEVMSCARYHPSNGTYSWAGNEKKVSHPSSEGSSNFQRYRVDQLLHEWSARFPAPEIPVPPPPSAPPSHQSSVPPSIEGQPPEKKLKADH